MFEWHGNPRRDPSPIFVDISPNLCYFDGEGNEHNERSDEEMKQKSKRAWWQKPGLGIMYQIEYRPGWRWQRNFNRFNASMKDENGQFKFNGPYCRIGEWVDLSRRIGVDYHIFEVKWHDGIVWFNTSLTDWKTPTDYAGQFAQESRKRGIPFMFYYSSLIDHNPQFHDIIPLNLITLSFPVMHRSNTYKNYLEGQIKEIIEQYHPDGLWFDWSMRGLHPSEGVVIDFLSKYSPNTVITFNNTVPFAAGLAHTITIPHVAAGVLVGLIHYLIFERFEPVEKDIPGRLHYTTYEAWNVRAAWRRANCYRNLTKSWELVSPAGRWWDDMRLRRDIYDLVRIAAIIMANGGRSVLGAASQLDGNIYPEHVKQLELVGEWFKQRWELFTQALPMDYKGNRVPGVSGYRKGMGTIGTSLGSDRLIHLVNLGIEPGPVTLRFDKLHWPHIDTIYREPGRMELKIEHRDGWTEVIIPKKDVERVDTILRVRSG